jgi:hypothetical protein
MKKWRTFAHMVNDYVTVAAYAEKCGYSRRRIYQLIDAGRIVVDIVAGRLLISMSKNPVSKNRK